MELWAFLTFSDIAGTVAAGIILLVWSRQHGHKRLSRVEA